MAPNIEDDWRASNAKLIKDMIQATIIDLYKFSLETQKKLEYILRIVDTSLPQTTVNDRGVQTEPIEEQVLPPLTKKIFVRQDLVRPEWYNGQDSLQQQQDTITVDIPIAANNFDQSNTVTIDSNSSQNLDQRIAVEQEEPPDNRQNQSIDTPIISETDVEPQSNVCTNSRQNSGMEVEETAVKQGEQAERIETNDFNQSNAEINTDDSCNNDIQNLMKRFRLDNRETFQQKEQTENLARLNNNQQITEDVSEMSNNKDSSESSEDSSSEDSSSDGSEDTTSNDREWLCTVRPVKSPYFPQIGDHLVYIQQCHKAFYKFVSLKKLYEIHESDMPWSKFNLKAHEFVKVIEISYKRYNHTRICCLRLERTDEVGEKTDKYFEVEYHYIKEHPYDFLILRQHFDMALATNWQVGSRFRRMLGNAWYFGRILTMQAQNPQEFPDSKFESLRIETDNGSEYNVSPWNIEPIDEKSLPEKKGVPVPVTSEDLRKLRYQPRPNEWHQDGRPAICRRVQRKLDEFMQGPIAAPFVKLKDNSAYVSKVEYPIDLEIISARLGNLFYRRVDALEFDVRYLAKNFETNEIELQSVTDRMGFLTYKHQAGFIMKRILASIEEATKLARRVTSEISDTEEVDIMIGDFLPATKRRMTRKKTTRCGSNLGKQVDQATAKSVTEMWKMLEKRRRLACLV